MLYPPKKRAYSPENKKTKDLSNLMNINSKFTGIGGSKHDLIQIHLHLPPRNLNQSQNQLFPAYSKLTSKKATYQDLSVKQHYSENTMSEEICL